MFGGFEGKARERKIKCTELTWILFIYIFRVDCFQGFKMCTMTMQMALRCFACSHTNVLQCGLHTWCKHSSVASKCNTNLSLSQKILSLARLFIIFLIFFSSAACLKLLTVNERTKNWIYIQMPNVILFTFTMKLSQFDYFFFFISLLSFFSFRYASDAWEHIWLKQTKWNEKYVKE
jgi:hypothetical protein